MMRFHLTFIVAMIFTVSAWAVPRANYLAAPKKVVVVDSELKLYYDLECANAYPDEWSDLVSVANDEGDYAVGVGMVLNREACRPGPKKEFVFSYPLKALGLSESGDVRFEPIQLDAQKTNCP